MTFHRGQSKFVPQINVQLSVSKNEMTVINDIEDESQKLPSSEQNEGSVHNKPSYHAQKGHHTAYAKTEAEQERLLDHFELSKDYVSSEAQTGTDISAASAGQGGSKKGAKKKIKKGLKRKVKIPPQWPGVIPATRRITIGTTVMNTPLHKKSTL